MIHPVSFSSIQRLADHPPACSAGGFVETGAIVARIFDLFDGTVLEPFAAEVAWRLVNGALRQPQH